MVWASPAFDTLLLTAARESTNLAYKLSAMRSATYRLTAHELMLERDDE
jgi:hypothetical protein